MPTCNAMTSLMLRSVRLLTLVVLFGRSSAASGPREAPDWVIVDRHVSIGAMQALSDVLELSTSQREFADPLWEKYHENIVRVDSGGAAEWELLGKRSASEPDFAGEPYSDASSELIRSTLSRSDLLLENFLARLAPVLSDAQLELLPQVREVIEWVSFFDADMGPSMDDLSGRHDVRELYRTAVLQGILPSEEQLSDAGAGDTVRASEEAYVAGVLQQIRWVRQHMRTARGERRTEYGPTGRPRRWWQRIQRLSLAHAEAIATVAENVTGADSAWQWRMLFARTMAPRLTSDLLLSAEDQLDEWLVDLDSDELREALLANAQAWRESDRLRIWDLVERGIDLINREGWLSGSSEAHIAFLATALERFAAHELTLREIARTLESAGIPDAMAAYRKGASARLDHVKGSVPLTMREMVFAIERAPRVLVELEEEYGPKGEGVLLSPPRPRDEQ